MENIRRGREVYDYDERILIFSLRMLLSHRGYTMLSIRPGKLHATQKTPPLPCQEQNAKCSIRISLSERSRSKNMMMIKGGKQGNRVSLSYQVGINQCKLQAASLLGVVVVVLSVIERQRSAASLTSGIVSCHRLSVLVGSDLACTLGRLVDWWCLPVAVSRRWGCTGDERRASGGRREAADPCGFCAGRGSRRRRVVGRYQRRLER